MEDVIIIGAGLSGLSAAYSLKQNRISALILEARSRTGGRTQTFSAPPNNTPVELGATWFADKHTYLMALLKELDLPIFYQYQKGLCIYELTPGPPQTFIMPDSELPSYRVAGGTSSLIERLVNEIGTDKIRLNTEVIQISEKDDVIELTTTNGSVFTARQVMTTLPPNLLAQKVAFSPALSNDLIRVMQQTHTWMSDAIKFAVLYERPFWRDKGFSGTVLSQAGIATEVYDHTNIEETCFALKGFLASGAAVLTTEQREKMAVNQLKKLLGEEALKYLSYVEKVWADDPYTHVDYKSFIAPHQNSGHTLFQQPYMNGKLYVSGSETSLYFGGYMDGAVFSGLGAAKKIIHKQNEI